MSATSPVAPLMTYRIRHCLAQNEWSITRETSSRAADLQVSEAPGMTHLPQAISWCYRAAEGRSSLVIVDLGEQEHRLRLHAEPEDAVCLVD